MITDELKNSRLYQELLAEMHNAAESVLEKPKESLDIKKSAIYADLTKMREIERIRKKVSAIKKRRAPLTLVVNNGKTKGTK